MLARCTHDALNRRPIQHGVKLAQLPKRPVQDVEPRFSAKVKNPEQMELVRDIIGAADFVAGDVEREELPQGGGLDLEHSLGVVGLIKRQDVESEAIANILRGPDDPLGQIVATGSVQPVAFQIEYELLANFGEMPIGGVTLGKVDLA